LSDAVRKERRGRKKKKGERRPTTLNPFSSFPVDVYQQRKNRQKKSIHRRPYKSEKEGRRSGLLDLLLHHFGATSLQNVYRPGGIGKKKGKKKEDESSSTSFLYWNATE